MLDHIIHLQAVVEVITNETKKALDILAKQHTKCTMQDTKTT
jgi:hypothetical protein